MYNELMPAVVVGLGFLLGVVGTWHFLKSDYAPGYRRGYRAGLARNRSTSYNWRVHFQGLRALHEARRAEHYAEAQLRRTRLMIAAQLPPYLHDLAK